MSDISSIDKTNANGEFLSMSLRRVQSLPRDDEAISRIQFYAGDRFVQGTPANSHVASGPIGPFKWAGMMPQLAMSAMPPSDERGFELQYASIREAQGGDVGNMAMSELLNLANGLYTSVNILRSGRRCADAYTAYLLWFRVSGRINDEVERKTEAASVYASDSRMEDLSSQASVLRDQIHALFRKATEELLRIGRAQLEDKDKDVDARGTFERLLQFITETRGLATRPQEDEITRVSKEVQARLQLIKHENAVLEALIDPAQRRSAEAALENLSSEYKDAGMPLRAAISNRRAAEAYLRDGRFMDAIRNARAVLNIMEHINTDPRSERGRAYIIMAQALMGLGNNEEASGNARLARDAFGSSRTLAMEACQLYITILLQINTPQALVMARTEFDKMGTEAGQGPTIKNLRDRLEEKEANQKEADQNEAQSATSKKNAGGWASWSSLWGSSKPEDPKRFEDKAYDLIAKPAKAAALYEKAAKLHAEKGNLEMANLAYRNAARFYEKVRNDEALVRVLEQVLELDYQLDPAYGPARITRERLGRSLLRYAQYAIESGNPAEASNAINRAIVHLKAVLPYRSVGDLLQYAYRIRFDLYLKRSLFVSIEITMREALNLNIITREIAESWIESVEAAAKTPEGKDAAEAGRARRSIAEMRGMVRAEFRPITPMSEPESKPAGSQAGAAKAVAGAQVKVNYEALGWRALNAKVIEGSKEARRTLVSRLAAQLGETEAKVAEILPRLGGIYASESAVGLVEFTIQEQADSGAILAWRIFNILQGGGAVSAQARADLARGLAEAFRRGEGGIDAKRKDGKPRPGEIDPAHIK